MNARLTFVLLLFPLFSYAQSIELSDQARISVITCGPFQGELYSAFGHSAFRVFDPAQQLDDVYNYGVFDFDQPNFYTNFAKGIPYYQLGVHDYPRFRDIYIYHNRFIHEQVLNLSHEQNQKLFDYLQWNALPANRDYRYDYFYDNCATRIRDVVEVALGTDVHFDDSHLASQKYSIRDLTDIYLKQQPWGDLGIDICLGLPMDKKASPREYMFLPDYIEAGFDHATVKKDSAFQPIVAEKKIVYASRDEEASGGLPHPLYVFSALLLVAVALTVSDLKKKKLSNWFDAILFGVAGLIGILLLFLWFATNHKAAANNFNLLWAVPTHVVAVIAFTKNAKGLGRYFLITTIICGLLLLSWFILPQTLNYSLIPVVLALGIRAFTQFSIRIAATK